MEITIGRLYLLATILVLGSLMGFVTMPWWWNH